MNFDARERALLGKLADVLIPAGERSLSASAAEMSGQWLDQVLIARPDLAKGLKTLLHEADGRAAEEAITHLRTKDAAFGILAEVVTGAYFMNPDVQRAIGYAGQGQRAIDPAPDYLADGLLDSVIQRGPIYRPTPIP